VNDENKEMLYETGVVDTLFEILKLKTKPKNVMIDLDESKGAAAKILWNLCFNTKCLNTAKSHVDLLKDLSVSQNSNLSENAKGILFMFGRDSSIPSSQPEISKKEDHTVVEDIQVPHIMISYQWDSQPFVKRVAGALRAAGYKLWLDIDDMQGSTLEAMANAVEGACVVLICMTRKYKESPNCRSEAEYTNKLRKTFVPLILEPNYTPDGWLGLMLGEKLYYPFKEDNFDTTFSCVIKALGNKGRVSAGDAKTDVVETPSHVPAKAVAGEKVIIKWSVDNVLSWLEKEELSQYKSKFQIQKINGRALWVISTFVNKESLHVAHAELYKQFGEFPYGNYLELIYALQILQKL